MAFDLNNPKTWPGYKPTIIAHDVARSRDRSTAVVGGIGPFSPHVLGMEEFHELPQGLLGQERAEALAAVDRKFNSRTLIFGDVSNDPTYAEVMYQRFGSRYIGVQITRHGDGTSFDHWQVKNGHVLVYTVGRTHLFDILHGAFHADQMRIADSPTARLAYDQLTKLQIELRDTGRIYTCMPGEHDDLGISCAMLVFAALHPHLQVWMRVLEPRTVIKRPAVSPLAWT